MILWKGLTAFAHGLGGLARNRRLTLELAWREVADRHAGQALGALWAVGHPLVHVVIYLFIFGFVFNLRTGGAGFGELDYPAYLLAGLLPWLAFQEAMNKGVTAIAGNASLVKQVVFPIEVLPVKTALAAFVSQAVGTAGLAVYILAKTGGLPWTFALVPVLWVFQALAMAGAAYALAAVGAYARDLKELVLIGSAVGMYLMPVAYLPAWVPERVQPLLYLNPFSYMTWCFQDACYYGRFEHWWAWPAFAGGAAVAFALGSGTFRHLKGSFGSVL